MSDANFNLQLYDVPKAIKSKDKNVPVYIYLFNYEGELNMLKKACKLVAPASCEIAGKSFDAGSGVYTQSIMRKCAFLDRFVPCGRVRVSFQDAESGVRCAAGSGTSRNALCHLRDSR